MWVKVKVGKEGVAEKEVEVKVLSVKEFFEINRLAKKLDGNIDEQQFMEVLGELKRYVRGISDNDPLVVVMDAMKKLIDTNTVSYEEYKKK